MLKAPHSLSRCILTTVIYSTLWPPRSSTDDKPVGQKNFPFMISLYTINPGNLVPNPMPLPDIVTSTCVVRTLTLKQTRRTYKQYFDRDNYSPHAWLKLWSLTPSFKPHNKPTHSQKGIALASENRSTKKDHSRSLTWDYYYTRDWYTYPMMETYA